MLAADARKRRPEFEPSYWLWSSTRSSTSRPDVSDPHEARPLPRCLTTRTSEKAARFLRHMCSVLPSKGCAFPGAHGHDGLELEEANPARGDVRSTRDAGVLDRPSL